MPLTSACESGHLDIVKFLLQRRPNADGVMEYVHAGIDAAAQNNTPLSNAIWEKHIEIVEFLLQKTEQGDYLLPGIMITEQMRRIAAEPGNEELQELLL